MSYTHVDCCLFCVLLIFYCKVVSVLLCRFVAATVQFPHGDIKFTTTNPGREVVSLYSKPDRDPNKGINTQVARIQSKIYSLSFNERTCTVINVQPQRSAHTRTKRTQQV